LGSPKGSEARGLDWKAQRGRCEGEFWSAGSRLWLLGDHPAGELVFQRFHVQANPIV
jgi:hypothetical protein